MLTWEQRSTEVANLINPAFCSLLLKEAISGYLENEKRGMSYPLSFLILPLILPDSTRAAIPSSVRTKLLKWIGNNPEIYLHFIEQARFFTPYTKEAICFGLNTKLFAINEEGKFVSFSKIEVIQETDTLEVRECKLKAYFLGKWMALAGSDATIFRMFGIKP